MDVYFWFYIFVNIEMALAEDKDLHSDALMQACSNSIAVLH